MFFIVITHCFAFFSDYIVTVDWNNSRSDWN